MFRFAFLLPFLGFAQCDRDESVAAYGAADQTWALQEIDGLPYDATALIRFPEEGRIEGNAPCNTYSATLNAPYPWFELQNLSATRTACAGLEAEGFYFAALIAMTQSEVSGDVLILRNEDGHEMVFKAVE
jgi:heat shock protein HslJ